MNLDPADAALRDLLRFLQARDYRFVTTSPRSHETVLSRGARGETEGEALRDLLGWSIPVRRALLPDGIVGLLEAGGALIPEGPLLHSIFRVSSEGGGLFLHSAHPTTATDSVFFGPDSYRFAGFIRDNLPPGNVDDLAEIGAGSGVGALTAARHFPGASVTMTDINPVALRLARINAAARGIVVNTIERRGLSEVAERFDLIVANPPYLLDEGRRSYRHGGEHFGTQVALDWALDALERLRIGGRLLLYSGAPVVRGEDLLLRGLAAVADGRGAGLRYEELDPDVWGEELARPEYAEVDRIAVGGAVLSV